MSKRIGTLEVHGRNDQSETIEKVSRWREDYDPDDILGYPLEPTGRMTVLPSARLRRSKLV